jgi:hypothetical protein
MSHTIKENGQSRDLFRPRRMNMTEKIPKRGGARAGAGRKATGRTVKTSSINLPPELWVTLDALRGEATRSAWIAAKIKNARL